MGLIVAVPSFKVRGDYLAIITLAFLMIVKSVIENIDSIDGPRGIPGVRLRIEETPVEIGKHDGHVNPNVNVEAAKGPSAEQVRGEEI